MTCLKLVFRPPDSYLIAEEMIVARKRKVPNHLKNILK